MSIIAAKIVKYGTIISRKPDKQDNISALVAKIIREDKV